MKTDLNIEAIEKKAFRITIQDGLTEIMVGLFLVLISGLYMGSKGASVGIFAALWILFAPRLLKKMKNKYAVPRVGYVEFPREEPKKLVLGMFGYILSFILLYILAIIIFGDYKNTTTWYQFIPLLTSILILGGFLYIQGKSGLKRFYFYSGLSVGLGIVFSLLTIEGKLTGVGFLCLILGLVFIINGTYFFIRFIRTYPPQNIEEEIAHESQ